LRVLSGGNVSLLGSSGADSSQMSCLLLRFRQHSWDERCARCCQARRQPGAKTHVITTRRVGAPRRTKVIADGENHAWLRETKICHEVARRTRAHGVEFGRTSEWTNFKLINSGESGRCQNVELTNRSSLSGRVFSTAVSVGFLYVCFLKCGRFFR
jgi:hypothetical protein